MKNHFLAFFLIFCLFPLEMVYTAEYQFVKTGETTDEVESKLGKPVKKDLYFKKGKKRDIWIYECSAIAPCESSCEHLYYTPCKYLFFEEGVLKFWRILE